MDTRRMKCRGEVGVVFGRETCRCVCAPCCYQLSPVAARPTSQTGRVSSLKQCRWHRGMRPWGMGAGNEAMGMGSGAIGNRAMGSGAMGNEAMGSGE